MDERRQHKRLFSIEDILQLPSVSSVALSPSGDQIVFVLTVIVDNSYRDDIVLMEINTGEQRKIAQGSSPLWSPDGKYIAYVGDNAGINALFLFETQSVTNIHLVNIYGSDYFIDHYSLQNFCWSPDGKSIAYVSTMRTDNAAVSDIIVINDLLYKTKGGRGRYRYAVNTPTRIWLVNIEDKATRAIVESGYHAHSISFSPDGSKISFVRNSDSLPGLTQSSDCYSVEILTEKVKRISSEKGSLFQPCWSPDGKYIAYLGIMSEISTNDSPAEDTQLYIVPASGGSAICLTRTLDRRVEQLCWNMVSSHIYFTAGNKGNVELYSVSLERSVIEKMPGSKGMISEYVISNDEKKILYVFGDASHRGEIFLYDVENTVSKQLTTFNTSVLNNVLVSPPECFWFRSFDQLSVQGWIIKPADFVAGTKYPLILVIHGGPHNMFGEVFEERMQLLAANGYGVLYINPRGSTGYGQHFSSGTIGAWGEGDYKDLMAGVDAAIEKYQWIDAQRLGVTGQSYGGYMTNRIITKTKRFKAAVADGSISNLISFAGTSLYHSLMESELQGSVYDNFELLWNCSPLKEIAEVSTPLLLLHGETDNEVPLSQAEEMYVAVKKKGVPTSLVIYKDEGHGWRPDLLPQNRIDVLKRMIAWFDEYLK